MPQTSYHRYLVDDLKNHPQYPMQNVPHISPLNTTALQDCLDAPTIDARW